MIIAEIVAGDTPGPHLLLIAGVHGDEYEPILAAREIAASLSGRLRKGKVTVVPLANESAYFAASRYGADGLDLARVCPGNAAGSVTEQAAAGISALIAGADYLVDMHTGGLAFGIYPLAGYMLHPDPAVLEQQRQMALACNLPVIWGTDASPDGRTLSVARDAGIPAIYLEYGGGTGIREQVVAACVKGFFNLLRSLGMMEGEVETTPEAGRYRVEDDRKDSGYLQGKMPAPAEGIFIAKVSLGALVKKGQEWGEIVDPVSGTTTVVRADSDGLVFLLRNTVKVVKGDALGGILPVENRQHLPETPDTREIPESAGKKVVIITGAAGGIGTACACQFAAAGYTIVVSDNNEAALENLAEHLRKQNAEVAVRAGNLEEECYWEALVQFTRTTYGRIDILVNNAAWRLAGSMRTVSLDTWEKTLRVCLTAPVFLSKQVALVMETQGNGGVIVNVSSVMADRPSGLAPAYIAAKGALDSMTQELAITYGRKGIRVVGIAPGYIDTALSNDYTDQQGENVSDRLIDQLTDFIPLGRGGRADEVARTITWLCSENASYITGTTLTIDGGFKSNFNPYSVKRLQFPDEF